MIISPSGLILLDYDPAIDILSVDLPDIRQFSISEVEHSLQLVVEAIVGYDIKKLFLDSSKAVIEVDNNEYRKVIMKFSTDLMKTRLKKLARIGSPIATQEQRAASVADELRRANLMPVDFRNFTDKADALHWLAQPI